MRVRLRLLKEEKSLDLLLHQLRQFPNGKHDDLVDSFTQALRVLPTLGAEKQCGGLVSYLKFIII
jgi:phage terminase large subunit-like protein